VVKTNSYLYKIVLNLINKMDLETEVLKTNKSENMEEILIREFSETEQEFLIRKKLTMKISNTKIQLNNFTSVSIGFMIMKKIKFGLVYSPEIENVINYVLEI
jgi:hypothetical protein